MSKTILNLPIRRDWQGVGNPYWTMFIFSLNKKTRKKNVKRTVFVYMSSVSVLFLVFLALLRLEHTLVQNLTIDGVNAQIGRNQIENCSDLIASHYIEKTSYFLHDTYVLSISRLYRFFCKNLIFSRTVPFTLNWKVFRFYCITLYKYQHLFNQGLVLNGRQAFTVTPPYRLIRRIFVLLSS